MGPVGERGGCPPVPPCMHGTAGPSPTCAWLQVQVQGLLHRHMRVMHAPGETTGPGSTPISPQACGATLRPHRAHPHPPRCWAGARQSSRAWRPGTAWASPPARRGKGPQQQRGLVVGVPTSLVCSRMAAVTAQPGAATMHTGAPDTTCMRAEGLQERPKEARRRAASNPALMPESTTTTLPQPSYTPATCPAPSSPNQLPITHLWDEGQRQEVFPAGRGGPGGGGGRLEAAAAARRGGGLPQDVHGRKAAGGGWERTPVRESYGCGGGVGCFFLFVGCWRRGSTGGAAAGGARSHQHLGAPARSQALRQALCALGEAGSPHLALFTMPRSSPRPSAAAARGPCPLSDMVLPLGRGGRLQAPGAAVRMRARASAAAADRSKGAWAAGWGRTRRHSSAPCVSRSPATPALPSAPEPALRAPSWEQAAGRAARRGAGAHPAVVPERWQAVVGVPRAATRQWLACSSAHREWRRVGGV